MLTSSRNGLNEESTIPGSGGLSLQTACPTRWKRSLLQIRLENVIPGGVSLSFFQGWGKGSAEGESGFYKFVFMVVEHAGHTWAKAICIHAKQEPRAVICVPSPSLVTSTTPLWLQNTCPSPFSRLLFLAVVFKLQFANDHLGNSVKCGSLSFSNSVALGWGLGNGIFTGHLRQVGLTRKTLCISFKI